MKKLLYVAPHLSTGGLPQYLTKKIELLKDEFEIYLVEWVDCTGGILVVTKNKIQNLIDPDKFFTLEENKIELIDIINQVQPDIIHLEEIPEFFMDEEVAKQIYKQDRSYIIIETSHDSSFDPNNKIFIPDRFVFVSEYQNQLMSPLGIKSDVVEYPIEYKTNDFNKKIITFNGSMDNEHKEFVKKMKRKIGYILDEESTFECFKNNQIDGFTKLSKNKYFTWY